MKLPKAKTLVVKDAQVLTEPWPDSVLWHGDVQQLLDALPGTPLFDLVVTSPPYNIGKSYEARQDLEKYLEWQRGIITKIHARLKPGGSLCWQVGNFVENGTITPLDIELAPIFKKLGMKMRNRIVWRFGHGLHARRRFSGRYEVIVWYTKSDDYTFNLDAVRVPAKYPGKKKSGKFTSHKLGKNPEDVWDIPNVKNNHVEKTSHPCQFPVGLVERLVLALSNRGDLVFDPFGGVASAGVAALLRERRFLGAEIDAGFVKIARRRLDSALSGKIRTRPHDQPVYDHTRSRLSRPPRGYRAKEGKHTR